MEWLNTIVTEPNIIIIIELGKIILTDYVFILCTIHFVHTNEQYYCFCTNTLYTIHTHITQTHNTHCTHSHVFILQWDLRSSFVLLKKTLS